MKLKITVDIDTEKSNLNEDELKDNIIEFAGDLLNGAYKNKVVYDLINLIFSWRVYE